jgi:2-phosphosulfolactate phosphatase
MKIETCTLETCSTARGVVAAVDVVRAFTTAAFAFEAGAVKILLAGSVEEALALRDRHPGALVMGELGGMPVEGFDLWNSPAQLVGMDLRGKTLVQRTSAGTQGIVRSTGAERLFAASFVVAGATAKAIRSAEAGEVTFVITGEHPGDPRSGVEDRACAEYIAALMRQKMPDPRKYLTWARSFLENRLEGAPEELRRAFAADLNLCVQVDRFPFALSVRRSDGLLIMEKVV